jgi:hypothetical protein
MVCDYINCNKLVSKDEMGTHKLDCKYRIVTCHHCSECVNYLDINDHYRTNCPNFPIDCSNKCGIKVSVSKMKLHVDSYCDNTTTECPFILVGCSFYDLRKQLKIHLKENLEDHLKLIAGKIKSLNDVTINQKKEIDRLKLDNELLHKEVRDTNKSLSSNHNELLLSIDLLTKKFSDMKEYFTVPICNFQPSFSPNDVFTVENNRLMKSSLNHGWYGIASNRIDIDQLGKAVVNMKIKKTANSCIMFGVTFADTTGPLLNGFYQQTEDCSTGYMFYCYNHSVYYKGRATGENGSGCMENDIITITIEKVNHGLTLSFRRNGNLVSDIIEIDQYESSPRIAVDLCDQDEIIFLN